MSGVSRLTEVDVEVGRDLVTGIFSMEFLSYV